MDNLIAEMMNVLLEAEVAPSRRAAFDSRYRSATGVDPQIGENYQIQPDKWGIECRIYFDGTEELVEKLEEEELYVERRDTGYGSDRDYRINNNEFFWELIERGYRLGEN